MTYGLLEFDRGNIQIVKDSSYRGHESSELFTLMTYKYLTNIAKGYSVNIKGKKAIIAKTLCLKLSNETASDIFRKFLKARALR